MELQEFFRTEEFTKYRKCVVEECIRYIKGHLTSNKEDLSCLPGALDIINRILLVPAHMTNNSGDYNELQKMIFSDLEELKIALVREGLRETDRKGE